MRAKRAGVLFLALAPGLFFANATKAQTLRTGDGFSHRTPKSAPVTQNQNSPDWVPVETEGQAMDFKLYDAPNSASNGSNCAGAAFNCEILQTSADDEFTPWGVQRIRPPAFSHFITSYPTAPALQQFGGCTFAATPSSMFTVASPFSATRGIVWQGYVAGEAYHSPPGAYSVAVVYSSSNECSEGDQEFGFVTDATQSADGQASGEYWIAYYSTATNAPQQQTSTPANRAVIGNVHSGDGGMIYISMYIIPAADSPTVPASDTGWDFRIQVLNDDFSFAQCSLGTGETTLEDCTVDIPISQMAYNDGSPAGQWPVDADGTMPGQAFITTGTQTSAWEGMIPVYQCSDCANGMWTNGLWVGLDSAKR